MRFEEKLVQGEFIKRYKRFFADVRIGGELIVAHVPNTGSLKSCLFGGAPCLVSKSTNPKRKLKATLHFIKTPTSWVGVNTVHPNHLVYEGWQSGLVEEWQKFSTAKREYKINKETRLDLVLARDEAQLARGQQLHHIEVKNVTYAENGLAMFPDAVTARGQKHLRTLMALKKLGHGAEIVFVVQRHDCGQFAPADHIDPDYGRLLRAARQAGVGIRVLSCAIDPEGGIRLNKNPLHLNF